MDEQAKNVFNTICEMLDDLGFKYDKQEEDLVIHSGAKGDDLVMPFMMRVAYDRKLVAFMSVIPIEVDDSVKENVAIALSMINCNLIDGCFVYFDGKISYKCDATYNGMMVGKKFFEKFMLTSLTIIDEYNDKLEKIAKEHMSVDDIVKYLG